MFYTPPTAILFLQLIAAEPGTGALVTAQFDDMIACLTAARDLRDTLEDVRVVCAEQADR